MATINNNNNNNNHAAAARARKARTARAQAAAAATVADAAAAAAGAVPGPEPELKDSPTPAFAPTPAPGTEPSTPACPPRQHPAQGVRHAVPCNGCLRSAVSGRFNGACYNAAVGSRCWRYADGFRAAIRTLQKGEARNEKKKEK
ncbi:hypothetical protein DL764_010750 [Monosporascus ibericus]|uniref:Uncharacterized protein n=1 Tax=Monosporascus ibericus TaxID=155417 RepID=A0A4Q4SU60_9PEZI|nr:hypothetical protein DL764_010750 [Monosporascus ibericus]